MRMPIPLKLALVVVAGLLIAAPVAGAATEPKPFGIEEFTMQTLEKQSVVERAIGELHVENVPYTFTQAGEHPWALSTTVRFASEENRNTNREPYFVPTRDPKDVVVDLPPGLLGDPQAVPRCQLSLLLANTGYRCPADTQVGVDRLSWFTGKGSLAPIVNVTPEKGQSAEFALENGSGIGVVLTAHVVHTAQGASGCTEPGGCYGLTVVSNEIPIVFLDEVEVTFWGVPADPSHDSMRGLICLGTRPLKGTPPQGLNECEKGGEASGLPPVPFLTMPTDCATGPETAKIHADSWEEPGHVIENRDEGYAEKSTSMPGVTGCNLLQFNPELEVSPDKLGADEPVGLGVNLKVPQVLKPEAPETPQLRNLVVTLPEGLSVSPGIVDGIQACNKSGPEGINFEGPESEEVGLNGELQLAPGHCPDASIVGTAKAFTPLLDEPVEGHVYLARPGCGGAGQAPCTEQDALDGNLYQLYLELGGKGPLAGAGVNLKVHLKTKANPATGQLTTVAENNPQLPFSKLEVHLNGGPRSPLDNPAVCGPAVTTSDWTPWSSPGTTPEGLLMAGTPDATPSSFYDVGGCPEPTPFTPGFVAGTVTPQAGQFSAFTLNLSRQDREQYVRGIQLHTPPGLLGMLSSVPLCGEPAANEGTCPESSKIGTTRVASGAGSHPFEIEGNVYLTGPYEGTPFGLSVVVHVVAGPFNLGVKVVRARIYVNPEDSTLTVTTDETGPHAIPQTVFGVPVRLKRVTVNIDRPGFMFNPTNCGSQQITGAISGTQGTVASVSSPFAVGGCKSLAFKPKFTVSTSGHTSRAAGASLDVKLSYPVGSFGNDANIAKVKVSLPKRLPSRLSTLQKACLAQVFNENPAACPKGSIVGAVRATTPLLPVGLSGPVYFVSHGGEAFPSLIIVLQGDGVRVDLTGATFINKAGITSSTFRTVPDVPVNTFELYLPQGKDSALAANGNLCTPQTKLLMPTTFIAQNGAQIKQSTKIQVTGCPKKVQTKHANGRKKKAKK
jgi:hypothetical protein